MTVSQIPNRRPLRRAILAAGCALPLAACGTWREQPRPLPAPRRSIPGLVRITRGDGSAIELNEAEVRGDSLVGLSSTTYRRVAMPLGQVKTVERRRTDLVGSIAVAAVVIAAAFGTYAYAILSVIDD
ncbi:MAG TPA: hypothetical protein VFJ82_23090 [Longimicrobium sp.]|nr:hypothetical protein [Longimicrobium sp.]